MIGLFASDLDGTLLGASHRPGRQVIGSIRMACDSGRHFAVATGRTLRTTNDYGFADVPVEAICANGAIVLGRDSRVIRHASLDTDFVGELLEAFPAVPFECITLGHTYVRMSRGEFEQTRRSVGPIMRALMRGMRMRSDEYRFGQSNAQILSHEICKINCRIADDPALSRRVSDFIAERSDRAVNAPFSSSMFEITAAGVNKGAAVAWLAGELGLSEDEVAVYGDGGNDVTMLGRFRNAYATHGALPDAKAAATHVLGSNVLYAVPRHIRGTVRREGPWLGRSAPDGARDGRAR